MHYLIQLNLYLIVFYAFYFFFLRRETFYQANRFYLMLSGIFSFLIPFMHTDWVQGWFVTREVSEIISTYSLKPLEIPVATVSGSLYNISIYTLLVGGYLLGLCFFTVRFGLNVLKTLRFVASFDSDSTHAFTFFGKIRMGRALAQYKSVLDHERVHVIQCHSFDIILFEVIAALCWFNPFVYILKKEIKLLHEFQADDFASKRADSKAEYAALLVSQQFGIAPDFLIINTFFKESFLKSRIIMLSKEESQKRALLKYGLVVPIFLGMMVMASASIAKSDNLRKVEEFVEEVVVETPISKAVKEVKIDLSEFNKNGIVKSLSDEEDLSFKPEVKVKQETLFKTSKTILAEETETKVEEIFVGTEEAPAFPGGETEMFKYLGQNIIYPKEAQQANVQGRVTAQFVIEKDGSISNVKILKGLGFGLDQEAVRAIIAMPKWSPAFQNGRAVRVYYNLPVLFSLTE